MATSTRYRRQVRYFLTRKCWQSLKECLCGHENTVRPLDGISHESGSEPE